MPLLPTRQLGKNGPTVTALGFGAMGLSTAYQTPENDDYRYKLLDRALELGLTFWDSADLYGDSEDLLGQWFKRTNNRDKIFLATKFGGTLSSGDYKMGWDSSLEHCKEACDKSLKRLGVDCIDLYYSYRVDAVTPIEKTIQAMVDLKK